MLPRISFILFRDFFTWLFQSGKEQLEVLAAIDIPAIQGLVSSSIFLCSNFKQTANFIQKIRFSNGIFHFSQFSRDGLSGWALGLIQDITVWKWKRRYNCFFWSLPLPVLSDSQSYTNQFFSRMASSNLWLLFARPGRLLGTQLLRWRHNCFPLKLKWRLLFLFAGGNKVPSIRQ